MKRLLSICIVITLLVSLNVSCVFADGTENLQEYGFELLDALNILDGINKNDTEEITRAEFTAMAVRSLNLSGIGIPDGSFSDVPAEAVFASEIYMAKSLRMTNGTADGIFSPDESVSADVALKMVLTAMGYEQIAMAYGGYPTGYYVVEKNVDILDSVSLGEKLSFLDAKIIITNALKADLAVISAIEGGEIVTSTATGRTLLSERFKLETVSGIPDAAGYITYDTRDLDETLLSINGKNYKSLMNPAPYFGMNVSVYHKDGTVYAIEKNDINKIVSVDASDIQEFSADVLSVYQGDKVYRYKCDPALSFIKNGQLIDHSESSFQIPHGTLTLIDNDGDNAYEVVIAKCYEYFVISGINAVTSTVYDANSSIAMICFDDGSAYDVCHLTDSTGKEISVSSLSQNDVLTVIRSDNNKICIAELSPFGSIKGTVEEITQNGYIINGTEYLANTYFKSRGIVLNAGEEYTFLLAGDMTLTSTTGEGTNGIVYGYLVDVGREGGLSNGVLVKILTSNGSVEAYYLADRITLDGSKSVDKNDIKVSNVLLNGEYPNYQLIRYRTNKDGEINLIDTADGGLDVTWDAGISSSGENSLTQYLSKATVEFRSDTGFGAPYFSFASGVIFAVPKSLKTNANAHYSDNLFNVTNVSSLVNAMDYNCDAYDFDDAYYPGAIVIYTEIENSQTVAVGSGRASHIVYQVSDVATEDGEITKAVRTFSRGTYYSYNINPDRLATLKSESKIPVPGDVIRFSLDNQGYISGIAIDADYDASSKKAAVKYTTGSATAAMTYISGMVKALDNSQLTLKIGTGDHTPGSTVNNIALVPVKNSNYAVFNTATGEVTRGVITDILPSDTVGDLYATNVVCRNNYYAVTDVFIYVK